LNFNAKLVNIYQFQSIPVLKLKAIITCLSIFLYGMVLSGLKQIKEIRIKATTQVKNQTQSSIIDN